jgi:hypothetical protein
MARDATLYQQAVDISTDYLGPAGERFMRRQITTHLRKEPENLLKADIANLIHWVQLTMALLTTDKTVIETFTERLLQLGTEPSSAARKPARATR